jgi:hypothetical protein
MNHDLQIAISLTALVVSASSFIVAQRSAARAKKAEAIKNLLGEKETVAFAALKLLRDGLPANGNERTLILAAVMQACIFERSDRSRALLYRVLHENRDRHGSEITLALTAIKQTFASMEKFKFRPGELDLERGKRRLAAVERVVTFPNVSSGSER